LSALSTRSAGFCPGEDLGAGLVHQRARPAGGENQGGGVLAAVAHRAGAAGGQLDAALAEELRRSMRTVTR
jgi:hypothetical protein